MNTIKFMAIILILAGVLGLAFGGFTYIKATHKATLGPVELAVKDKQTVIVPAWAGIGTIVVGGLLLLYKKKAS